MTVETPGRQDHWLNIDPERLGRYEKMFRWNPETAVYYEAARIGEGHVVADFGCGPGHAAVEFARWVGPEGHVHALDINADFIDLARTHAETNGVSDRITAHHLTGALLPLPDGSLDRIVARNTIIYVEDPVATFAEFRRVLKPGGIAHAIEGDWRLTVVEPVAGADWQAVIDAASWAWPRPEMGRQLYGVARQAGFAEPSLQVLTTPDTTGRLRGMIESVAGFARESGTLAPERIAAVLDAVDGGIDAGTYVAIAPQFIVSAAR